MPEAFVPTYCAFCGIQCGMYLRVTDGKVIGVEARDFPHNRGKLCPKGVVAYQQVDDLDRRGSPETFAHRSPSVTQAVTTTQ
jgi:assimilatory nitrate reductase catalytic subunit